MTTQSTGPGPEPEPSTRSSSPGDPYRAPQPAVTRLNRNVLTVIAVLGGVTAIVALVFLSPGHRSDASTAGRAPPATAPGVARATFLDLPPKHPGANGIDDSAGLQQPRSLLGRRSVAATGSASGSGRSRDMAGARDTAATGLYAAALASRGIVLRPVEGAHGVPSWLEEASASVAPSASAMAAPVPMPLTAAMAPGGGPGTRGARADVVDAASGHGAFLRTVAQGTAESPATITTPAVPASPYVLTAGTVIPAALVTDVVSDLPGALVGQVIRDVYDAPTERVLLIPKGARLIGRYEDRVAVGQDRLLVAWTRLIFPDGRSVALPGPEAVDRGGAAGISEHVNNHYWRLFGHAALLSLLSAGLQLSQPQQGTVFNTLSPGQVAAGAAGQQFNQTAMDLLRRNGEIPPTISVSGGAPFPVLLTTDVVFAAPYVDTRALPTDTLSDGGSP